MLNTETIAQLNRALENSFAAIKRDINEVKLSLNSQAEQYFTIKKSIEEVKTDSITKDKINVLKIKIGELNEGLKKVWDIEKQLKSLQTTSGNKVLTQAIDELHAKLIALNLKVEEVHKHAVTESQLKTLVAELNAELNNIASNIRDAEMRRDEVRRQDIEHYAKKIVERVDTTNNDLANLRKEVKNYVDKDQVKKILEEINNDFDSVKNELSTMAKKDAVFVKEHEVKDVLKSINKEFDGVTSELTNLKKQQKDFITAPQIKGLIDDISNEFDAVKAQLANSDANKMLGKLEIIKKDGATRKDIDELRKSFSSLDKEVKKVGSTSVSKDQFEKELKQIDRELETVSTKSRDYGASVVLSSQKTKSSGFEKQRRKYLFGNFLIFISFILLLISISSYYFNEPMLMDNFAIGAVIAFLIGISFRIYAVLKSRKV